MADLAVWIADGSGHYLGKLFAPNAGESFEEYAAHAAANGQKAFDASSGDLSLASDGTIVIRGEPIVSPPRDPAFQADVQICRAFVANPTPTGAEAIAAEKALIRTIARIVRGIS